MTRHGASFRLSCVAALLLTAAPAISSQSQVFRAAVHTVPVYATVTDSAGTLVTNLDGAYFEVRDNGERRPITVFRSDVQPITMAILLDTSPSLFPEATRLQSAIATFVDQLLPADRACLGTFSHVVSLDPALTNDHDILIHHLGDDTPFPAGTALWDAIDAGRAAVASADGRRVVLVVTDAEDNASTVDIDAVRARLEQEDILVYGVGVRGREGIQTREMRAITGATGGSYFELKPEDDVATAMRNVANELHAQYLLGFSPRALDDRVHRIDVSVTKPGLTVRARRSYVAFTKAELQ